MKISLVLVLTCLACAVAQEEFPVRRNKRTAHFLLHQFADLLGYDIIPKSAVVTDIRSRLGLPPLQTLGQPQAQTPQTQTPQTQPPPKTSTMGTSTTTGGGTTSSQTPAKTPTTSAQAPPSSEGPVRLPLPLNILNRFPSTIPILNPIQPTPPATPPAARLEQPVALQHTNLSLNFLFSRVPTNEGSSDPTSASDSTSTQSDDAPTGPSAPSAEAPSVEDENPPRFVEDNFVFNPRDVSGSDEDYNPNLAFSGWRPPRPEDDFAFEESSEVKYNPAPTTRSATPARLDPVLQAYPHNNYISAFRPVHRRRSAMSQHSFRAKGSDYGYVTYH